MYDFLLRTIIMLSLAVMIYLVARSVPRVGELITPTDKKSYLEELFKRLPLQKLDAFFNSVFEKLLRRLKIYILKIDNLVGRYLNKFKAADSSSKEVNQGIFENKADSPSNSETQEKSGE